MSSGFRVSKKLDRRLWHLYVSMFKSRRIFPTLSFLTACTNDIANYKVEGSLVLYLNSFITEDKLTKHAKGLVDCQTYFN